MIIIGYKEINKIIRCEDYSKFVELNSSYFKNSEDFIHMARNLSNQGYPVILNANLYIYDHFKNTEDEIVVVYPSLNLQRMWENSRYKYKTDFGDRLRDIFKDRNKKYTVQVELDSIHYNLMDVIVFGTKIDWK